MDNLTHVLILFFALWGSSMVVHGRRPSSSYYSPTATYDVLKFGAVGNGITDDTQAFKSAWEAACGDDRENVKIAVASGKTYMVSRIEFHGPCNSKSIIFEILGNIVAPPRFAWSSEGGNEWLYFYQVDGLSVVGNGRGQIHGGGATWWEHGDAASRPTAMRFSNCNELLVQGLKHVDSQRNHISVNGCNEATISGIVLNAPEESPNTDGINIAMSTNVTIRNSVIATGDDCIAINGGTSNVFISNVSCGPGHGISIGSLGKNGQHEQVEGINIKNCTFIRADNGVRIKTWQGGSGFARNINFSQITFIETDNPVIIDQYYCPHQICSNQKSAVKISNVGYFGLHGTTLRQNAAINFNCSETVPCTDIKLEDVRIESPDPNQSTMSTCYNAYGTARALSPALNCLLK